MTAALDQASATGWGRAILRHNPEFRRIRSQLADGRVAADERIQLITDLEALHTFSGIINRTRRRDIGAFTIRKPETVTVAFTPEQQRLHDELMRVQVEILSRLRPLANVKFMMTTIRRQAASCLMGLAPFLESILNRRIDELEWTETDGAEFVSSGDAIDSIRTQIETIIDKARSLDPFDPNWKPCVKSFGTSKTCPTTRSCCSAAFGTRLPIWTNISGRTVSALA